MEKRWWYGHGYVIMGQESQNSSEIEVLCPELLPMFSGKTDGSTIEQDIPKMTDENGDVLPEETITLSETIRCFYYGDQRNTSIPDVVPGEIVVILNREGDDSYYWYSAGDTRHLRKTEHVRIPIMNRESNSENPPDEDTWFLEMDSAYNRGVRLIINKGRGEEYAYVFEFLPDDGTVTLEDNRGNRCMLDSANDKLMANILNQIKATAGSSIFAKAPIITLDGNVQITGDLEVGGSTSIGGDLSVTGYSSLSGGHGPH